MLYKIRSMLYKVRLYRSLAFQLRNFKILSFHYGQWASIWKLKSEFSDGEEIPWYTYPAIEYLSHLDLSGFRVFEYGSCNSTIWWGRRSNFVEAVENNSLWYDQVKNKMTNNTRIILEEESNKYVDVAKSDFDVYIVDGILRDECIQHLLSLDSNPIFIVFDNSDWYPESIQIIREQLDFIEIDFHGFGPSNPYTWTTSLFINPKRQGEIKYSQTLRSKTSIPG